MKKKYKLAIACGGTGGHFYPGVSIARAFLADDERNEVLLFLSGRHVEVQREYAAGLGIPARISKAPARPPGIAGWPRFAHAMVRGCMEAHCGIRAFQPDAFLAMGSFASVPNVLAAWWNRVPVYLHDGNARIGRANLALSRFARHLGTAFPAVNAGQSRCPCSWTGMPVRPELLEAQGKTREQAMHIINSRFDAGFSPDLPVLLIFGGSQGARTFNETLPDGLVHTKLPGFQVIHLTGTGNDKAVSERYENAAFRRLVLAGTDAMDLMYTVSDLVFCRSGGSTVAELALFGKYAILVPFPFAADLHQHDNAAFYCGSGAAEIMEDQNLNRESVAQLLQRWLQNPNIMAQKGQDGLSLARPEAANNCLEQMELLNSGGGTAGRD